MPAAKNATRTAAALILLAVCFACTRADDSADRATLEKEFEESMRNVVLDGSFTVNRDGEQRISKEKYTISSVSPLGGDIWVFQARIEYGDHDVTLPIPVKLLWAGDTPMVSLTDTSIPGLGTFTARVIFYRDSYVGFWQHGDVSGNQFGRIVRNAETAAPAAETPSDSEPAATPAETPKTN